MSTTADLLTALRDSIATAYPVRSAFVRPGRVACVVVPEAGEWDEGPDCDPWPTTVTAEVHILAASADEQGAEDLPHHIAPVAALVRAGGFRPQSWRASSAENTPSIVITAVAHGTHG